MSFLFRASMTLAPLLFAASMFAETPVDRRTNIQTLNTPRSFPKIESKAKWQNHAREIREQILVSCGLWPMPDKTALNPKTFGKIFREDYSIEISTANAKRLLGGK